MIWQKSLFKHESFNSLFKVGSELSLFYHGILTLSGNLFHNCISLLYQKPCLIAPDKCQTILPSLEIWQMYVKGQLSYFLDAHVWIFFHNSSFRKCPKCNFYQIEQVLNMLLFLHTKSLNDNM